VPVQRAGDVEQQVQVFKFLVRLGHGRTMLQKCRKFKTLLLEVPNPVAS
jgi:hypothetical protein